MKTLHIITGLSSGGAERALHNLLSGGLADQFESAVVSLRDAGVYGARIRSLGVPVHELGIRGGMPRLAAITRLMSLVRTYYPDVIQGWMYHGNMAASLAATLSTCQPTIAWNVRHSLYSLSGERPLTRQVIRGNRLLSGRPHAIVYNSHLARGQHEKFGFVSTRGSVIPNGFDIAALVPTRAHRAAARKMAGIKKDELVVGHVARFHLMKDHAGFLRAALQVLDRWPETRFLLLGRDVSLGNPALKGIVPEHLAKRFIFLGERSDVFELMQAMDIFCLSSIRGEAFPNVLGEAMALGIPCVTTDVGDSADVVGDTGRIVPPAQAAILADAISDLLSVTPRERTALGVSARERVKKRYALAATVAQYGQLYEALTRA